MISVRIIRSSFTAWSAQYVIKYFPMTSTCAICPSAVLSCKSPRAIWVRRKYLKHSNKKAPLGHGTGKHEMQNIQLDEEAVLHLTILRPLVWRVAV